MLIRVLGAAAGGGFPQWNCNCQGCRRGRKNDARVRPRTQASIAVSADGERWALLNASPDLPYQLRELAMLHPRDAGGMHFRARRLANDQQPRGGGNPEYRPRAERQMRGANRAGARLGGDCLNEVAFGGDPVRQ